MAIEETIKRINELAHKAKTTGLTKDELKEREELRNIYSQNMITFLYSSLYNISVEKPDGNG